MIPEGYHASVPFWLEEDEDSELDFDPSEN